MLRFYFLIAILFLHTLSKGQEYFKKTRIESQLGFIASTSKTTPFLLRNNQYGLVPLESQVGFLSGNIRLEYDSLFTQTKKLKPFGFGYGFTPHINFGGKNQMLIPEAYAKVRFKSFEFYAGRRREIQGLVDTLGTMGSYIWSGNALPIPKVEISIPNYTPIIGNGLVSMKGNFAHGWFGKGDSVQNVLLHQKSLYVKIGKPNWKIRMIGGFNHQVQWGGYPTKPFYDELSGQTISRFSSDFSSFIKVVTGVSLNRKGQGLNSGAPSNEATNRAGNHLGTIDLGLEINPSNFDIRILIYRQSIYDDGSLYYMNNISDGLWGFSFKLKDKIIKNVCFEYLDSRNQGGAVNKSIPELRGIDNYFNNGIYQDSWVYKKRSLGNPLFYPERESEVGSNSNLNYISNNRIQAINFNVTYNFSKILLVSQLIISHNLGTYQIPLNNTRSSIRNIAQYNWKLNNSLKISLSNDISNTFIHGFDICYLRKLK